MDYYSKYPEIALLSSTTSSAVVTHVRSIFGRHGIPQIVVSDNGPQFASDTFRKFAGEYDFHHVTSSPRYPQANGLAEKGVHIVKRLFQKAAESKSDPYLALLLMGRNIRNRLPSASHILDKLQPREQPVVIKDTVNQAKYYDKSARPLSTLRENVVVRIRDNGYWGPLARVIHTDDCPRS